MKMSPREGLLEGVEILLGLLGPYGFSLRILSEGKGSGGHYCHGLLVSGNRSIELYFKRALGQVRYHHEGHSVAHEFYLKSLGYGDESKYPGFGSNSLEMFQDLVEDLELLRVDFLDGGCNELIEASLLETECNNAKYRKLSASFSGDTKLIRDAKQAFRKKDYAEANRLFQALSSPSDLSMIDRKWWELAILKCDSG